jgi:protoporphyrinogen oxidase
MPGRSRVRQIKSSVHKTLTSCCPYVLQSRHQPSIQRRCASSLDNDAPSIGILGGGITGLATAYYLLKEQPNARVTVYEKSQRKGGWIQSRRLDVPGGQVLFETGSRSLRPDDSGIVTSHLINDLGLQDNILFTDKKSPSARNRYIYYPDHLVRMPGPGMSVWEVLRNLMFEPAFKGAVPGLLGELVGDVRPSSLEDESVGAFISRRMRPEIAQNLASAVFHGIYAGDVWQLSVNSLLPRWWIYEKDHGSLIRGALTIMPRVLLSDRNMQLRNDPHLEWGKLDQTFGANLATCSIYTFKNGIQQLVDRLAQEVEKMGAIISTDKGALLLRNMEEEKSIEVRTLFP